MARLRRRKLALSKAEGVREMLSRRMKGMGKRCVKHTGMNGLLAELRAFRLKIEWPTSQNDVPKVGVRQTKTVAQGSRPRLSHRARVYSLAHLSHARARALRQNTAALRARMQSHTIKIK